MGPPAPPGVSIYLFYGVVVANPVGGVGKYTAFLTPIIQLFSGAPALKLTRLLVDYWF